MEEVKLFGAGAPPPSSFSDSRAICLVCTKQFSQYTCPRCNTRYCSLQCYKGHSLQCTESFMRDNVMEELRLAQPSDETKRKTMEMLRRVYAAEEEGASPSDDGGEQMFSDELVKKALSGGEINMEDLSDAEQRRFRRALVSGELSKLIEPWTPWWVKPAARDISLSSDGTQLIRQVESSEGVSSSSETWISDIPPGPESPIPPLRQLTQVQPSPLLAVHLVGILYSYCFVLRLYNGDWHSDPFDAATMSLTVSGVLGNDDKPESILEALSFCLEQACSPAYRHVGGIRFALGLVEDVVCLLSCGGYAITCALCDLRRMVQAGERISSIGKDSKGRLSRHKLRAAERKLLFVISWSHEQPDAAWESLAAAVSMEKATLAEADGRRVPSRSQVEGMAKSKVVIEEL